MSPTAEFHAAYAAALSAYLAAQREEFVTDLMEPMLADRYDIRRVLSARVMPPENPERAAEVRALMVPGEKDTRAGTSGC